MILPLAEALTAALLLFLFVCALAFLVRGCQGNWLPMPKPREKRSCCGKAIHYLLFAMLFFCLLCCILIWVGTGNFQTVIKTNLANNGTARPTCRARWIVPKMTCLSVPRIRRPSSAVPLA